MRESRLADDQGCFYVVGKKLAYRRCAHFWNSKSEFKEWKTKPKMVDYGLSLLIHNNHGDAYDGLVS